MHDKGNIRYTSYIIVIMSRSISEDGEEVVNIRDTDWWKEAHKEHSPGDAIEALTYRDGLKQGDLAEAAKEAVRKGGRFFVLGSSYIPDNFESIGIDGNFQLGHRRFYGTAPKLSKANIGPALSMMGGEFDNWTESWPSKLYDVEARDLIEDFYTFT